MLAFAPMDFLLPVCTGVAQRSFYQDFAANMEAAIAELGHHSSRLEFAAIGEVAPGEADTFFRWSRKARCDAVIDLCCWGWRLSQTRLSRGGEVGDTLFDDLGAAYVAMLFDQPYFQALPEIHSRSLGIAYSDRNHPAIIDRIYPSLDARARAFVPPATSLSNDRSPRRWSEKHIDVLYVGNLHPEGIEPFWRQLSRARAYDATAELALADGSRPLHECAAQAVLDTGIELAPDAYIELLRTMEYFLRQRYRHRLVTAVAASGVPMQLCGSGWDGIGLPANVAIHAATDYPGFMELLGSAGIYLDASTYLRGANDRIFHCAVNRTAFFTNASEYPREVFGSEGGAFFYSFQSLGDLGERIRSALARPQDLEARTRRSRNITLADHLWRERVRNLVALVEKARAA